MGILGGKESPQTRWIIDGDRGTHGRPLGQRTAPCTDTRLVREYAEVGDLVEHIEVAERWCEGRIDETEAIAGEEGASGGSVFQARIKNAFQACELADQCLRLTSKSAASDVVSIA